MFLFIKRKFLLNKKIELVRRIAKIILDNIKSGKWNTAYKSSQRIKDKDFKNLINWLYLLKTGNNATFSDYQIFISKNSDIPRIGRLRY